MLPSRMPAANSPSQQSLYRGATDYLNVITAQTTLLTSSGWNAVARSADGQLRLSGESSRGAGPSEIKDQQVHPRLFRSLQP